MAEIVLNIEVRPKWWFKPAWWGIAVAIYFGWIKSKPHPEYWGVMSPTERASRWLVDHAMNCLVIEVQE